MDSNLVPFNVTADYGDVVPPSPPSQYDDEFEGPIINNKWAISGATGNRVIRIQEPTYLQMRVDHGIAQASSLQVVQTIVSPTNFLWQAKVRLALLPSNTTEYIYSRAIFGFNAPNNRYFALAIYTENWEEISIPFGVYCSRVQSFLDPIPNSHKLGLLTGLDVRLQVGISGNQLVARISNDGWNWLTVWSENYNNGGSLNNNAPNQMLLRLSDTAFSAAGYTQSPMMAAWDYVRDYSRFNI